MKLRGYSDIDSQISVIRVDTKMILEHNILLITVIWICSSF